MLIRQRRVLKGMRVYVPVHINVRTCVFILSVIVAGWRNRKPNLWPQHHQDGGGEQHHNCHITATTSSPPASLPEDEWEERQEWVGGTMGGKREGWGMNNYTWVLPPMSLQRQNRTANHRAMRWSLAVFWSSQQQHFRWVYFNDKDGANGILTSVERICKWIETEWYHRLNE